MCSENAAAALLTKEMVDTAVELRSLISTVLKKKEIVCTGNKLLEDEWERASQALSESRKDAREVRPVSVL